MNIQAPPNLMPDALEAMIAAGINDWGGVSPVTPDHVNPEAPWPALDLLAAAHRRGRQAAGRAAGDLSRLCARPGALARPDAAHRRCCAPIDAQGLARPDDWIAGAGHADLTAPSPCAARSRRPAREAAGEGCRRHPRPRRRRRNAGRSRDRRACSRRAATSSTWSAPPPTSCAGKVNGDTVSYVVTRNINYTNICYFRCQFCAFSKGKLSENLRGRPYNLDMDEIVRRCEEAWERGATEVCLQGGIHPEYTGATYLGGLPRDQGGGARTCTSTPSRRSKSGRAPRRSAAPCPTSSPSCATPGSSSLPGTAAEILDDEVRAIICPDKVKTAEWLQVMEAAHGVGLRSTVTIMYGHVDRYEHWARHLLRVRGLAGEDRRLHRVRAAAVRADGDADLAEGPLAARPDLSRGGADARGRAPRAAPGDPEHPDARGSSSGREGAAACLNAGCNDMGGTLMNESISRAAGASFGQEMPPEDDGGADPLARPHAAAAHDPLRRRRPPTRIAASFGAAPLSDPINTPARKYDRPAAE